MNKLIIIFLACSFSCHAMEKDKPKESISSVREEIKKLKSQLLPQTASYTINLPQANEDYEDVKHSKLNELLDALDTSRSIIETLSENDRIQKQDIIKLQDELDKKDLIIRNLTHMLKELYDFKTNMQEEVRKRLEELRKSKDSSSLNSQSALC